MDTKKLDKWAESLLDTGKRNKLISFKDTKASSVEVLLPSAEELFDRLDGAAVFDVFDPDSIDAEDDEDYDEEYDGEDDEEDGEEGAQDESDEDCELDEKAACLARWSGCIKRKNQILVYNAARSPLNALSSIAKKAKEFVEETGVNVAYMAFGFIHWKESASSSCVFDAPVLLVPIQVVHAPSAQYSVRQAEEDIIVNPTFSYKMEAEHGVNLPEYADEGLMPYLEKVRSLAAKFHWTVTAECKISTFSFLKINMYRDLKDNEESILANQIIRRLLDELPSSEPEYGTGEVRVADPLVDLHCVVDADASQIEAIEMAKSGKSFVLQGPPGTGKSQTIANIIAECLSDGKKVLFVAEKLAALNVTYEKLRQAGLGEFCLQLHSHKANKKDVIEDICAVLRTPKSTVSARAEAEIALKKKAERQLDGYAAALHAQHPVIEKSLYQLYESYSALRTAPDVQFYVRNLSEKGAVYLAETVSLLEQYADYIPSIGYDYRKNPWYGYVNQDTSYQTKNEVKLTLSSAVQCLQKLASLGQELSERYGIQCGCLKAAQVWNSFFAFAAESRLLTPALLNGRNFAAANAALPRLQELGAGILADRDALNAVFKDDVYKLDGEACRQKLTGQFSGFFSRLFSAEYRQLAADLRSCRKDGRKPSYSEACALAERLAACQQKEADFARAEAPVKALLGSVWQGVGTDWDYIAAQMPVLGILAAGISSFGRLEEFSSFASERSVFQEYQQKFADAFAMCDAETLQRADGYFDKSLDLFSAPCRQVLARLSACLQEIGGLGNWCHFRSLLSRLDEAQVMPFLDAVISLNLEARHIALAFKKQFCCQWIDCILSGDPVLSSFNRISQDKAISTFKEKDVEQFEINKARLRADLSAQRPSLDVIASGSALSVLLREGEKKRRRKSIRSLLAETGDLVQRLKPCFLMSPLSVSTYLAPDSVHFDVVVFDEASQVFPQDAVGAIYRANQLIVVGDSKQMPPSNFFNASMEVDDNDEESGDVKDFESILDMCSGSMQQLRLCWHYRSRYEQLIAFSNKNFYNNSLVTFPSSRADAPGIGVDYYHVDGLYDRRSHTNRKEAEFIVDLIYRNIDAYPNRSLGVVAFSISQQNLIDRLLSKRRQAELNKDYFFRQEEKEPFFIKNLETVQGDERDTIIFSTAYGYDAQGRLLHNFGPLNRVGGERRLNVAVTRAKHNVQLVSSMHYTDIDLSRTAAEGAKLLREYLDYAENGSIALARTISVNPFEQFDSDFELEVCEFLRENGFAVDTQVGCSGFRIDLGLKRPDSSDYVLAIECDGATYHSSKNARDRDRLRQEVLERMGWTFYRIWSTDWFRNKAVEQDRLLEAAAEAVRRAEAAEEEPDCEELEDDGPDVDPAAEEELDDDLHLANSHEDDLPDLSGWASPADEELSGLPVYRAADIDALMLRHPASDLKGLVKDILEVEAPLAEDLLLKRMVRSFGREKVTSVVKREFAQKMRFCQRLGITRRNGFLYLDDGKEIQFRRPGDIVREVKHIAPEELAAGMLEILRQNGSADKSGLYHALAEQCGVTRVGRAINEAMDEALDLLRDRVVIDGSRISLKQP